ncbi:hypothetical protein BRAS3843_620033 [Bradyrhizobium sp. STM 3843]|uniref:hypothetical protein n=1 Tax=Bradyrhizobium sp. STM 3843 TaxID=551947 RepID=UPI00024049E9|nr:hypothetical protein [Bradyrhizobium sp. STM 3843]CCE11079.1 hypothetical protein BRAS3843_620033 [Bradyrhizobium sp. STM 3843]
MGEAAVLVAVTGFAVGTMFPITALLPFLFVVLMASILFSVHRDLSLFHTALVIILAQAIIQYGYCLGVVVRFALIDRGRGRRPERDNSRIWQPRFFDEPARSRSRVADASHPKIHPPAPGVSTDVGNAKPRVKVRD